MSTPAGVLTVPDAPLAFHLLAKPTGAVCNLDCAYCGRKWKHCRGATQSVRTALEGASVSWAP